MPENEFQFEQFSSGSGEENTPSGVVRVTPEVEPARAQFISKWTAKIRQAEAHHKPQFTRMREDMEYARHGADKQWVAAGNYVANITQRQIARSVASLYAKNPKAFSKLRKRLNFKVWDGEQESYEMAATTMTIFQEVLATKPEVAQQIKIFGPPPEVANAQTLLQEIESVKRDRKSLEKIGKTLEILFNYYTSEQEPNFKKQMKQLVRRTKTTGVGFVELGFQRILEKRPEVSQEISDVTDQLATIERLMADLRDGETQPDSSEVETLRTALTSLREQETVLAREGLVFRFPRAMEVIFDTKIRDLSTFAGAKWLAIKMLITPEEVQEAYKIDLKKGQFTEWKRDSRDSLADRENTSARYDSDPGPLEGMVCVWRVQDKATGTNFVIADGYPDYLRAPSAPEIKTERFFTVRSLVFNGIEHENQVYPFSDVHYMKPMQDELNRSRQGLREHKHANRPAYATARGRMEDVDKAALRDRPPNAVIELNALNPGEKIEDLLMPIRPVGIDPNVYETNPVFEDMLRVNGNQEANIGTLSGGSATESAISEGGRITTESSDVDELDELLAAIAKDSSQIMLLELNAETVEEIVGPGAIWPVLSREEVVRELFLEVKAGSSGRPNRPAELANRERAMPFLLQMPGLNPAPILKDYLQLLDIDFDEALMEGLPSIVALNAAAGRQVQPGTGDESDPQAQGDRGGEVNSPTNLRNEPGPQGAFPTNGEGTAIAA